MSYPDGWINEPFNSAQLPPLLEHYMPQKHLPASILVHDPWRLLSSDPVASNPPEELDTTPWNVKVAELEALEGRNESMHPSWVTRFVRKDFEVGEARRREDNEHDEKKKANVKEIYDEFLKNPHSKLARPQGTILIKGPAPTLDMLKAEGGVHEDIPAPVYVLYPLPPDNPWPNPSTANVYVHPNHRKGVGNHSATYSVEMEMQRTGFISPLMMCQRCAAEDAVIQIAKGLVKEKADLNGRWVLKGVGNKASITVMEDGKSYWTERDTYRETVQYEGPFQVVKSRVPWQNPAIGSLCEHNETVWIRDTVGRPQTAKFRVVAKTETVHDGHLQREAENYQEFPREFFTRYSGYHLVNTSVHRPSPVGPLVPQFYGYYEPEDGQKDEEEGGGKRWNTPLLLMEDCGTPIWESKLDSIDEKCAFYYLVFFYPLTPRS